MSRYAILPKSEGMVLLWLFTSLAFADCPEDFGTSIGADAFVEMADAFCEIETELPGVAIDVSKLLKEDQARIKKAIDKKILELGGGFEPRDCQARVVESKNLTPTFFNPNERHTKLLKANAQFINFRHECSFRPKIQTHWDDRSSFKPPTDWNSLLCAIAFERENWASPPSNRALKEIQIGSEVASFKGFPGADLAKVQIAKLLDISLNVVLLATTSLPSGKPFDVGRSFDRDSRKNVHIREKYDLFEIFCEKEPVIIPEPSPEPSPQPSPTPAALPSPHMPELDRIQSPDGPGPRGVDAGTYWQFKRQESRKNASKRWWKKHFTKYNGYNPRMKCLNR